ncbi:hypothetical protein KY366_04960 [Candidatus Woesearchaeota archaeon]|nr:hypothetical protein [Candidatus Woesearchaeota archaeon]
MVGNISNFSNYDLLRAFLLIKEPVSREKLSSELELGEGTIRTILDILKDNNLISSKRQGHFLSEKGTIFLNNLRESIEGPKRISYDQLHPKLKKAALLVKNCNKQISFKERDIAIKNSAEAALLFRFDKNLFLPQAEQDIIDTSQLNYLFQYKKNDLLIITFADSYRVTENSALAVCMELSSFILKDWQSHLS